MTTDLSHISTYVFATYVYLSTCAKCSPTSDGSAAVVVASEEFVKKRGLEDRAVRIVGQEMVTDMESTFNENSPMNVAGYGMSKRAAEKLYRNTGLSPKDFQVVYFTWTCPPYACK